MRLFLVEFKEKSVTEQCCHGDNNWCLLLLEMFDQTTPFSTKRKENTEQVGVSDSRELVLHFFCIFRKIILCNSK